jgi:hypothetical protein
MAGPEWSVELPSIRAEENLVGLIDKVVLTSFGSRQMPTVDMPLNWHSMMFDGVDIPHEAYRGAFRGSAHPALVDYEVTIDAISATRAINVQKEIDELMTELRRKIAALDGTDGAYDTAVLAADFVRTTLDSASWLHGEWIRIHPFVNGNGRIARLWILWICARYGLPQIMPIRPRPDWAYGPASMASMAGDHTFFLQYLLYQYNNYPPSGKS